MKFQKERCHRILLKLCPNIRMTFGEDPKVLAKSNSKKVKRLELRLLLLPIIRQILLEFESKHVNYNRTNTINTHQEKNHRIRSLQHISYKQNLPEQRNRKRDPESRKKPVHRNQILNI